MDYFTDVYLKRINRFGNNIQTRVHGKMENDFENKLVKSVNRVELYDNTDKEKIIGVGVLETKKINETEVIDYLCTRIDDKYDNGFIFYTIKPFFDKKQAWMVLYQEQYETIGYNRYVVVLLENELEWIGKDGLFHNSCVHYVGEKEGKIRNNFKITYDVAVSTPNKTLTMICPKTEFIYKNLKINISDEAWRVSGYDKISVPGVMYVTLEEDYIQKANFANQEELNKWSIISSQGTEIAYKKDSGVVIDFYCTYDGVPVEQELDIQIDNKDIIPTKIGYNSYSFSGGPATVKLTATLKNNTKVKQNFSLVIIDANVGYLSITGPENLKVFQTLEYELSTSLTDFIIDISSEKGCFTVERVEGTKVYLKGEKVGKDNIVLAYGGAQYLTPINIINPWM